MSDRVENKSSRRSRLAGAAMIMMATYFASRATGLIRDIVVSAQFGTDRVMDAYLAAIRIPDLVFQVTAGGAVASAFIPVLAAYLAHDQEREANEMIDTLFSLSVVVLSPIIVLLIVFAPEVMHLLAPEFEPEYLRLSADLARILLISPLFFTIGCFVTGVLNSNGRFLAGALAPTSYNLGLIFGATVLAPGFGIQGLALGAAIGSFLFLLVQLPGIIQVGYRYRPRLNLKHVGVREVGRLMAPRTVGLAVVQVNFVVTLYLASGIPGAVASLNYAWLITMLPLGLIAMAISSAVFPSLASLIAKNELDELRQTVQTALRFILFLTVPASVGLWLLRYQVISVLLERGRFTAGSTETTAVALGYYVIGLVAMAAVEIMTRVFYAYHDTKTPVAIAFGSMALNALLAFALIGQLSFGGLALAIALSSIVEALLLAYFVQRRLPGVLDRTILVSFARSVGAAIMMGLAVAGYGSLTAPFAAEPSLIVRLVTLLGAVGVGAVTYAGASFVLGVEEFRRLRSLVARRRQG